MNLPALPRKVLELLGLARRAGALALGAGQARLMLRRGQAHLVWVAADASPSQQAKVVLLAEARGIPVCWGGTRRDLGSAVGAGPVSALAVTDPGLARAIRECAHRKLQPEGRRPGPAEVAQGNAGT